jgi:hypothetical protein
MNCVSFRCARLLVVGALAAAVITRNAAAQRLPEPLDQATYKSPNGKLALTVDPSDIYGRYAGSYRVVKDGKEVRAKTLPFTLFKSAITDTGVVVGCAYTLGEHGFGEKPDQPQPGDLIVAIIDPAGKLRLKQTAKRQHGRVLHALPFPTASGLVVDEPNDRLILRVNDYGDNEIWWTYRLSTGSVLDKRHPHDAMRHPEPDRSVLDAQLLQGTPSKVRTLFEGAQHVGEVRILENPEDSFEDAHPFPRCARETAHLVAVAAGQTGPKGEIVDSKHFFKNFGANGIRFRLGRGQAFETLHRRQGRPINGGALRRPVPRVPAKQSSSFRPTRASVICRRTF